jgi:hypothetical protein
MAVLAVLGILWIFLVTSVDYYDDFDTPLLVDEFLTYARFGWTIVASLVLSVLSLCVQQIIERNRETECRDANKRGREDDNRCHFWAPFFLVSALLFTLQMIFYLLFST